MNQRKTLFCKALPAILFSLLITVLCLGGCSPKQAAQAPAADHITGVVVSVDKAKGIITVKHDAIPGKMEAMTMPFSPADPAALSQLHAGDKISADMSVQANGAVLDNIKVLDGEGS